MENWFKHCLLEKLNFDKDENVQMETQMACDIESVEELLAEGFLTDFLKC